MSEMLTHLLTFYKYGGKQLYYFNTYDGAGEIEVEKNTTAQELAAEYVEESQEDCESCTI